MESAQNNREKYQKRRNEGKQVGPSLIPGTWTPLTIRTGIILLTLLK